MRSQIPLGRVFGIKIGLHYSWFLIALLIVVSLSAQFRAASPAWSPGLVLTLSGCSMFFLARRWYPCCYTSLRTLW